MAQGFPKTSDSVRFPGGSYSNFDAILGKALKGSVAADRLTSLTKNYLAGVDVAQSLPSPDFYDRKVGGIASFEQFESASKRISGLDWASRLGGISAPRGIFGIKFDAARWGEWVRKVPSHLLRLEMVERELAHSDPACSRLAVLLDNVGAGRALVMMERMVVEGSSPLVERLEEILLDIDALNAFEAIIRSAELPAHTKADLLHALEHLGEGSTDHALPPLVLGLEGALRHSAQQRGDRRQRPNARAVAAVLGMKKGHELLIAFVYDHVNVGRHGGELDRREASIFAMVGLVLWMDECLEKSTVAWLGRELDQRLGALAVPAD